METGGFFLHRTMMRSLTAMFVYIQCLHFCDTRRAIRVFVNGLYEKKCKDTVHEKMEV